MKQMDEHFKELVYKYTNKLYVTAYNLCNNPSDAEDIVQETFMKYLKKKPIFANEEHEKAWLLRVTINLAKDYNKSFWNRRTEKMSEAIEDHSTDHGIYEMISNLPDKYKILLILRYQEGLTYKEIGEILHRKTSTVSAQIQKAKECIILFIPLTSYATGKAVGVLKEKVQDTNLSNEDINDLYVYLKDNGYTDQQIKELQELHTNDRGQTYGAEAFLPDLVVVISDQGEVGYVYAKELEEIPGSNVNSPSEAAEYMKNRDTYLPYVIDVYDSDGETKMGTFTIQE